MPNYAIRVTLPYHDMSGVVKVWSLYADKVAVFQHEADEDVNKTHIHIGLLNCEFKTPEALKRKMLKQITVEETGNKLWSFKVWDGSQKYLTYMSKGTLIASYLKLWDDNDVNMWKEKWIDTPPAPPSTQTDKKSQMTKYEIVQKVWERMPKEIQWGEPDLYVNGEQRVLEKIREVLIENKQAIGLYKVIDIYDAFTMYHQKSRFFANCLQALEKRKPRI